jgi:hypothetical protein
MPTILVVYIPNFGTIGTIAVYDDGRSYDAIARYVSAIAASGNVTVSYMLIGGDGT